MAPKQMANSEQQRGPWDACPPGELTRMVQRVEDTGRRQHRKQVMGTILASTVLFAFVVLALGSLMGPSGNHYGGIACSVCRSHLEEYQSHLTGEQLLEDDDLLSSMQVHLEKCQFCRGKFNARYPGLLTAVHAPATRQVVLLAGHPLLATCLPATCLLAASF